MPVEGASAAGTRAEAMLAKGALALDEDSEGERKEEAVSDGTFEGSGLEASGLRLKCEAATRLGRGPRSVGPH